MERDRWYIFVKKKTKRCRFAPETPFIAATDEKATGNLATVTAIEGPTEESGRRNADGRNHQWIRRYDYHGMKGVV